MTAHHCSSFNAPLLKMGTGGRCPLYIRPQPRPQGEAAGLQHRDAGGSAQASQVVGRLTDSSA